MDAPTPWYKRDILPAWLPGWLAASLLIAASFAAIFGLFLEDPEPYRVAAVAGACGFAIAIVILSFAALRYQGPGPNRFAPPAVIRYPVVTLVAVVCPLGSVADRKIRGSYRRGGRTFVSGDAAEVIGLIALVLIVLVLAALIVHQCRAGRVRLPAVLSLGVAVATLGYAVYLSIRHHTG